MKPLFFLSVALLPLYASAAPYIVTEYIAVEEVTYSAATRSWTTIPQTVYTETIDGVVPIETPYTALETITSDSVYAHVTIVEIVLPLSAATESYVDYSSAYGTSDTLATNFVVPITYSPSPTCSQNWTWVTNVPIYIPAIVEPQISPATITTTVSTVSYLHYVPQAYTTVLAILNPADIDSDDLASASSSYEPNYLSDCYTPTTYCGSAATTTGSAATASCSVFFTYDNSDSGYGSSYYYDDWEDSWRRQTIIIAVCVPVGWVLIWLLLGLLENWMSFKGLMLGQKRKRGLPYSWCCLSFLFLCFTGPTYKARSVEEQAVCKERWDAFGAWEKFKLWMKWGFRWKYPEVLGEEPEVAKRALRQGLL